MKTQLMEAIGKVIVATSDLADLANAHIDNLEAEGKSTQGDPILVAMDSIPAIGTVFAIALMDAVAKLGNL